MAGLRLPFVPGLWAFRNALAGSIGATAMAFGADNIGSSEQAEQLLGMGAIAFGTIYLLFGVAGAVQTRVSDVVLDAEGFGIVGGPRDGFRLAWKDVDPTKVHIGKKKLAVGDEVLAETSIAHERDGLATLAAAFIAASSRRPDDPPRGAKNASVLRCASCGAQAAPADEAHVKCPRCGGSVDVPADVRERMRAARTLREDAPAVSRLVARVRELTPAARTNQMLAAAFMTVTASVFFAVFGVLRGWPSPVLLAVAASLVVCAPARLAVANRTAAIALAMGSGAREPESPDEPHGCRVCGAPLPAAKANDPLVVRCVYCAADNVLGLDLRVEAGAAQWERGTFELALGHRKRGEIVTALLAVAAIGLVVAAFWLRR
ncbi:MAG TPA: zinc ribbon domain-containing protein [Labilithrix sp.]|jgi:hypothetical protein